MANLGFAGKDGAAVVVLLALSDVDAANISSQIDEVGGKFAAMSTAFDKLDENLEGAEILATTVRLGAVVRSQKLNIDTWVQSVVQDPPDGIQVDGSGLKILIENKSLLRLSKALELRNEYERITLDTRVLTDMRPVFDNGGSIEDLRSAVINHTLRLTYKDNSGARSETHFAMDTDDLENLKDQVDRAIQKAQASRELLTNADVFVLEPLEGTE